MGWLMSRIYDRCLRPAEEAGLRDWRRELLAGARGDVLELGAGTGGNLDHYPRAVTRLVLAEPDRHMREMLRRKVGDRPGVEVVDLPAESLPFPAGSFDTVVATLVLCSVQDPARVMAEIRRVLRPGGAFLFLEHVAAPGGTWTHRMQRVLEPVWRRIAGNCHLTRETGPMLEAAGFQLFPCVEAPLPGGASLTARSIRGVARPPVTRGAGASGGSS